MRDVGSSLLLDAATATGYSLVNQPKYGPKRTFQAVGATTAGAGAATIIIQASNKTTPVTSTDVDWLTLGTITLTLSTTQTSDGFTTDAPWKHIRAKVSAISGTNAAVSAWMGS